ncbi:unnamed protein product [Parnassius apollo]|uniref:(apollo) hypothetical protein n=1 Tax=Parnassius apollo TaxID=110799 RepID=A0A8S3XQE4_PARAO|nr:unnamed protein product [Parnassius apollo]
MAFAGTNISLSQPDITQKLTERIDDLKQKIAAWGKRIRRFTERSRQFNHNRLFQSDQKRLYKSLERSKVCGAGQGPDQADIIVFWRGLWSEPVNHSEGPWMEVVASQGASVTPMDPITITPEDVAEAKEISKHTKYDPPNRTAVDIIDTLRQKLAVKCNRLKRYQKSRKRREDNALFTKNEKLCYRRLQQSVNDTSGLPRRREDVEKFWRSIWSEKVIHNETATWITREEQRMLEVPEMQHVEITEEDVTQAVYKSPNWKATGPDKIHNFWLKKLFYTNQ